MKKLLRHTMLILSVSALSLAGGFAVHAAEKSFAASSVDTTVTVNRGKSNLSNTSTASAQEERSVRSIFTSWVLQPFRSSNTAAQNDKSLSNVKVFPNPSGETLSLSFRLSKRADVSVKIMDALGNELYNLMSQPLDAGLQNQSLDIPQKLSAGFYFVRVSAGSETVVKRISIF